jgi:monoamine oxidase
MIQADTVLENLAREILMVDGEGKSLIPEYEIIIERGFDQPLPADADRRDVLIIGAGIAGLLTGRILKKAGYNVTILEANDSRVGGRVKTFHTKADGESPFKDPRQYAEAGAMRIPTTHRLVNRLIDVLGLRDKVQSFFNVDVDKNSPEKSTSRTWLKTNGVQVRRSMYSDAHSPSNETGFPIPSQFQGKTANDLLRDALAEPNSWINTDSGLPFEEQIKQQIEGWKKVIQHFDEYSMLRYLRDYYTKQKVAADDQEKLVAYIGTLQNLTSRLFLSFFHSFVDTFYISSEAKYVELAGGNWQLPNALASDLKENLVMEARAIEIQWSSFESGMTGPKAVHRGRPGVYVRTINEPIVKRGKTRSGRVRMEREFTADYMVVTIPFSALRFVSVTPDFSFPKRRAIIELHYDSATKVLLEFSERFWEWDATEWARYLPDEYRGHDAYGGGSITDSPNRFIYYPSHAVPGSRGGVILASYTWADDASRWDSIPSEDRYNFALKGLTELYGKGIKRFFTGFGKTESWMENYYSFGEAAVFTPCQLTTLHPHIPAAEGLVHFAGEHTSLKHAWIEGAIESGVRVAKEIHERATRDRVVLKGGKCNE